jgi:hypothetical protein
VTLYLLPNRSTSTNCPPWCEFPNLDNDDPEHAHASPRRLFKELDEDGEVLFAATVRAVQLVPRTRPLIDFRTWHAGDPGQPPSDVEALLTVDEARRLAAMLTAAVTDAEHTSP